MAIRIVAALILGPLVLLAFYIGSPFADLLVVAVAGAAAWEWVRLCQEGGVTTAGWIAVGLAPAAVATGRVGEPWHLLVLCGIAGLMIVGLSGRL